MNEIMTRADRESLLKIACARERVTKSGLIEAGAKLLADFDQQLEAAYSFDDDKIWKEAAQIALQVAEEAQAKVRERSRELGIPDQFEPSIHTGWLSQGEQESRVRRNELRGIARRQVDALIKEGKRKVETASLDVQTGIIASGLSDEAKAFLDKMPTAEHLMPKLILGDLEKTLGRREGYNQRRLHVAD
jgi:hypothetical protein